jgi:hypothetical protein
MRKLRSEETADERLQRLKENARKQRKADAAADHAADERVRRNIEERGA